MNCAQCGHDQAEGMFCSQCGGDLQHDAPSGASFVASGSPEEEAARSQVACGYSQVPYESRYLSTEGHLLALGFWPRLFAFLGAVGGLMLVIMGMREGVRGPELLTFVAFGSVPVCLMHWLGLSLQRFNDGARILSGCLACLATALLLVILLHSLGSLSMFVATGLLLGLHVWMTLVLFSSEAAHVCSLEYRHAAASSPQAQASLAGSPFFLGTALVLAALIALGVLNW